MIRCYPLAELEGWEHHCPPAQPPTQAQDPRRPKHPHHSAGHHRRRSPSWISWLYSSSALVPGGGASLAGVSPSPPSRCARCSSTCTGDHSAAAVSDACSSTWSCQSKPPSTTAHLRMEGRQLLWSQVVLHDGCRLEDRYAPVGPHARVVHRHHRPVRQHTEILTAQVDAKGRVLQQPGTSRGEEGALKASDAQHRSCPRHKQCATPPHTPTAHSRHTNSTLQTYQQPVIRQWLLQQCLHQVP